MPAPEDPILTVLREWVEKAENDLKAAIQILKLGSAAPMDTICFHAQQLTNYAAVSRYPEAGLDITLAKARKAVAIARRVRRQIPRLLPWAALRRRRK